MRRRLRVESALVKRIRRHHRDTVGNGESRKSRFPHPRHWIIDDTPAPSSGTHGRANGKELRKELRHGGELRIVE